MEPIGDVGGDIRRDAIALVAHDDNSTILKRFPVEVVTIKEGTINRDVGRQMTKHLRQIDVVNLHMSNAAHRSLHGLWIVDVGTATRTEDVLNTEPVCQTDDSAKVARVLHVIESEAELAACHVGRIHFIDRLTKDGKHLLGRFLKTHTPQLVIRHLVNLDALVSLIVHPSRMR